MRTKLFACAAFAMAGLMTGLLTNRAGAELKVGQMAPDFTVASDNGELKLSSFRGKKHVVLIFDRAHW